MGGVARCVGSVHVVVKGERWASPGVGVHGGSVGCELQNGKQA